MSFRIVTDDPSLKANMEFKRESRVAYFTLTYRLNEGVKQKDRKENQDSNGGGGEIDMGE